MAPPSNVTLEQIPGGTAGTLTTLRRMHQLVREAVVDPGVRDVALAIVRPCPGRAYTCQLRALRAWLAGRFRFRRDPYRVEWAMAPAKQLATVRGQGFVEGDCDDAAILAAALGQAVGFPARFVVLGFLGARGPYGHVYTELQAPASPWVEFDVTRSRLPTPPLPPSRVAVYPIE